MLKKKSQAAMEFMAMTGIALFAMLIFTGILFYNTNRVNRERMDFLFEDLGYSIQYEFNLANRVRDGYYREFKLPNKVEGIDFNVNIQQNVVIINADNRNYYKNLPNVTINSQLIKGLNIINKTNGTIYLN